MIVMQVTVQSVYLTDDTKHAVFPNNNDEFASYQRSDGGHYEKCVIYVHFWWKLFAFLYKFSIDVNDTVVVFYFLLSQK